jgi:hypothetical protein
MRWIGRGHLDEVAHADAVAAHGRWVRAHMEAVHEEQRRRTSEAVRWWRRELVNVREALAGAIDEARWEDAAPLGALVALAVADDPHVDVLAQLHRLAPDAAALTGETDGLRALAAGTAAWLEGDAATAERLLGAALAVLPVEHRHHWMARFFRVVGRMFAGDRDGVEADAAELRAEPGAPPWVVATGYCCAALMCRFTGDADRAGRWMVLDPVLLAETAEVEGFVAYTRGELASENDPDAAVAAFEQAYAQCDARGHVYNREVAAIGRAAVLVRCGRGAEAAVACHALVGNLFRLGMWPQVWTTIRLAAELLVAVDDLEPAVVLLSAADADRLSPPLLGADLERRQALWARLGDRIDRERLDVLRRHGEQASRADVVDGALTALARHAAIG